MSAATASNTKTIYIPLLDEGLSVSRPTNGIVLAGNRFLVLATPDYDAEVETWAFPPGTIVTCSRETGQGGDILLAAEAVSPLEDRAAGRVATGD